MAEKKKISLEKTITRGIIALLMTAIGLYLLNVVVLIVNLAIDGLNYQHWVTQNFTPIQGVINFIFTLTISLISISITLLILFQIYKFVKFKSKKK